ncbi:MAG: hypothetical protein HKO76_07570 [Acidimicrobiia bacterium]|nr:hypothetical protein [Acidimicrobiia bacterium]
MGPDFKSFADQYLLIKISEEKPDAVNPYFKRIAKNVAAFGAGAGIGTVGAVVLHDKVLKKLLPGLSPRQKSVLAGGAALLAGASGALSGRSAYRTMRQAQQEEKDWLEKKRKWKGGK